MQMNRCHPNHLLIQLFRRHLLLPRLLPCIQMLGASFSVVGAVDLVCIDCSTNRLQALSVVLCGIDIDDHETNLLKDTH